MTGKTILFPTDFSENSLRELEFVAQLCKKSGYGLLLAHIGIIPVSEPGYMELQVLDLNRELEKKARTQLHEIAEKFKQKHEVPVYTTVCISVNVQEGIRSIVQENDVEYIFMTSHASGNFFEKILTGTQTEHVANAVHVPMIIIPEHLTLGKLDKILLAVDLENDNSKALKLLKTFLNQTGAKLEILHISSSKQLDIFNDDILRKRITDQLENPEIKFHTIQTDKIRQGLETFVTDEGFDMLAVTRIDRGAIDNLFHRSLTSKLIYSSKVPLLVLHN